ncbi:hypothetical protein Droror1_Dr00012471 [Drosera rotundifolia]
MALLKPAAVDYFPSYLPDPDIRVVTSAGNSIPAHSSILAFGSAVLESVLDRPEEKQRSRSEGERVVRILGVPDDAVSGFMRFLYSSRCTEEEMEKYGVHLLALSHVYSVPPLKQKCTKSLADRLTVENVIDKLQLARLCDAPDLYIKCMKLVAEKFKSVEKTEAWKFLQKHDPRLELEIFQFMDEADSRKRRTRRHRQEQSLYLELNEAMECLVHICTEGCTDVGPYDMDAVTRKEPCSHFSTCKGLQLLIKHFASCEKRVNGGCSRCTRIWQLLKLHALMCDRINLCKVPLCRQFKLRMQQQKRGGDAKWRLLVRKVMNAKAISSLSLAKRKREAEPRGIKLCHETDEHL